MNDAKHLASPTAPLMSARYLLLRSYRKDNRVVSTPIWFGVDGDALVFRTARGPKTRRLARCPDVEVQPCDYRGIATPGALGVRGTASFLEGAAAEDANRLLHDRYGWQWNTLPLVSIPGVVKSTSTLSWRDRLRRARTTCVWPESAIVRIELEKPAAPDVASRPLRPIETRLQRVATSERTALRPDEVDSAGSISDLGVGRCSTR